MAASTNRRNSKTTWKVADMMDTAAWVLDGDPMPSEPPPPAPVAVGISDVPQDLLAERVGLFERDPPGQFVRARYGITHYRLSEPTANAPKNGRRVVVMAHGIGTNSDKYNLVVPELCADGITCLRYDYFGHGYSIMDEESTPYTDEVFMAQLEDLLCHVLDEGEELWGMVGHSTGGIVSILAAHRMPKLNIRRICLISPAIWSNKPLVATIGDVVPDTLFGLVRSNPGLKNAFVKNPYLENIENAFAKTKGGFLGFGATHRHPVAKAEAYALSARTFDENSQFAAVVMSIALYFLNENLLESYRQELRVIANGDNACRVKFQWGTEDVVVPYTRFKEALALSPSGNITIQALEEMGHESLDEDYAPITKGTRHPDGRITEGMKEFFAS